MQQVDIVIIGGAATGSILALALSSVTDHQIKIALVEKSLPDYVVQGGFDGRSIALANGALQKLVQIQPLVGENLGSLVAKISTPIKQIHISDQGHFAKATLSAKELNLSQLGAVIELATLGDRLAKCIAQQSNIQLFCPDTVEKITQTTSNNVLYLASGERLCCQLVVAADGIQSQIAKMCGVETVEVRDYQQAAIIANVELGEQNNGQAFERFTSQGPFALLPLTENTMSLVWCVKNADILMAMEEAEFLGLLQQQFGWKLGRFKRLSKRFVYPLKMQKAQSHTHHRLAIVGNASQLIHPVAGQGFNLGMRDLFELAMRVGEAFKQKQDIGEFSLLVQFEQARIADQQRIMQATSGLISLFCCDFLPVQILRNAGLIVLSHSNTLREQVMHFAMK